MKSRCLGQFNIEQNGSNSEFSTEAGSKYLILGALTPYTSAESNEAQVRSLLLSQPESKVPTDGILNSNLNERTKECHNELTSGEIVSLKILSRTRNSSI
nr:hypothetical protein [Tanacetum cinerariifolium]